MNKKYTVAKVLRSIGKHAGVEFVNDNVILAKNVGIGTWGKLDYLGNNGYRVLIGKKVNVRVVLD